IYADNSSKVYLNGILIGASDDSVVNAFVTISTSNPALFVVGVNTIWFDVTNGVNGNPPFANPTAFDYEATVSYGTGPVLVGPPKTKDDCKDGKWQTYNTPRTFKNQGDCIQFVNTGK